MEAGAADTERWLAGLSTHFVSIRKKIEAAGRKDRCRKAGPRGDRLAAIYRGGALNGGYARDGGATVGRLANGATAVAIYRASVIGGSAWDERRKVDRVRLPAPKTGLPVFRRCPLSSSARYTMFMLSR